MLILNYSGDIVDCYGVFPLNVNKAVFAQLIVISWGLNTTLFHNEINIYIYHIYHPQEELIIE